MAAYVLCLADVLALLNPDFVRNSALSVILLSPRKIFNLDDGSLIFCEKRGSAGVLKNERSKNCLLGLGHEGLTPRRKITVTSSLHEISKNQLGFTVDSVRVGNTQSCE